MEFQDRILQCVDCGAEFVWTAGEQQFFADKISRTSPTLQGVQGKRASRPAARRSRAGGNRDELFGVRQGDDRPFKPTQGRPVFCKECFQSRKFAGAGGV